MKAEHVSNWSEPNFYKRLVQVLANEKIEVIDVKYSTAPLLQSWLKADLME